MRTYLLGGAYVVQFWHGTCGGVDRVGLLTATRRTEFRDAAGLQEAEPPPQIRAELLQALKWRAAKRYALQLKAERARKLRQKRG